MKKKTKKTPKNVRIHTAIKAGACSEEWCANFCGDQGFPPGGCDGDNCQCGFKQA